MLMPCMHFFLCSHGIFRCLLSASEQCVGQIQKGIAFMVQILRKLLQGRYHFSFQTCYLVSFSSCLPLHIVDSCFFLQCYDIEKHYNGVRSHFAVIYHHHPFGISFWGSALSFNTTQRHFLWSSTIHHFCPHYILVR